MNAKFFSHQRRGFACAQRSAFDIVECLLGNSLDRLECRPEFAGLGVDAPEGLRGARVVDFDRDGSCVHLRFRSHLLSALRLHAIATGLVPRISQRSSASVARRMPALELRARPAENVQRLDFVGSQLRRTDTDAVFHRLPDGFDHVYEPQIIAGSERARGGRRAQHELGIARHRGDPLVLFPLPGVQGFFKHLGRRYSEPFDILAHFDVLRERVIEQVSQPSKRQFPLLWKLAHSLVAPSESIPPVVWKSRETATDLWNPSISRAISSLPSSGRPLTE